MFCLSSSFQVLSLNVTTSRDSYAWNYRELAILLTVSKRLAEGKLEPLTIWLMRNGHLKTELSCHLRVFFPSLADKAVNFLFRAFWIREIWIGKISTSFISWLLQSHLPWLQSYLNTSKLFTKNIFEHLITDYVTNVCLCSNRLLSEENGMKRQILGADLEQSVREEDHGWRCWIGWKKRRGCPWSKAWQI